MVAVQAGRMLRVSGRAPALGLPKALESNPMEEHSLARRERSDSRSVSKTPANVASLRDTASTFEDIDLVSLPTAQLGA